MLFDLRNNLASPSLLGRWVQLENSRLRKSPLARFFRLVGDEPKTLASTGWKRLIIRAIDPLKRAVGSDARSRVLPPEK